MIKEENCLFVILGATGDLTRRKLIPAIYKLLMDKKINNFAVIGLARSDVEPMKLLNESKKYIRNIDKKVWDELIKRFYYSTLDFYDQNDFKKLEYIIGSVEKKHNLPGNRIFYLATMPEHFATITSKLQKQGIAKQISKKKSWKRVVFEKPFGQDLISARKLNKSIKKVFKENQIYRIDHYLGKELVQNISVIRFTNTILEPLWNKKYIDHVQIIVSEDLGVEGRGAFYDNYGALKDIVQNHMMQLLSLITMEAPKVISGEYIRDEKVKVLNSVKIVKPENIVLGQYQEYKREKGIKDKSRTETFAALKLLINNKRWKNVPFYLMTGKNMKERITAIHIVFKKAPCHMFKGVCNFKKNHLSIQIQPEEGFHAHLNYKVPGMQKIMPVKMDFCQECIFGMNTPVAYENLLFDVVRGDPSVFIRTDEIEQQWKIIDRIIKKRITPEGYRKGSYPTKADKLIKKDNRKWHLTVD